MRIAVILYTLKFKNTMSSNSLLREVTWTSDEESECSTSPNDNHKMYLISRDVLSKMDLNVFRFDDIQTIVRFRQSTLLTLEEMSGFFCESICRVFPDEYGTVQDDPLKVLEFVHRGPMGGLGEIQLPDWAFAGGGRFQFLHWIPVYVYRLAQLGIWARRIASRNTMDVDEADACLHAACAAGLGVDEVKRLIVEFKADVDSVLHSTSPLHLAAGHGHVDLVRLLLQDEFDADPGMRDGNGDTALMKAVRFGQKRVVTVFRSTFKNNDDLYQALDVDRALRLAKDLGHDDIAQVMFKSAGQRVLECSLIRSKILQYLGNPFEITVFRTILGIHSTGAMTGHDLREFLLCECARLFPEEQDGWHSYLLKDGEVNKRSSSKIKHLKSAIKYIHSSSCRKYKIKSEFPMVSFPSHRKPLSYISTRQELYEEYGFLRFIPRIFYKMGRLAVETETGQHPRQPLIPACLGGMPWTCIKRMLVGSYPLVHNAEYQGTSALIYMGKYGRRDLSCMLDCRSLRDLGSRTFLTKHLQSGIVHALRYGHFEVAMDLLEVAQSQRISLEHRGAGDMTMIMHAARHGHVKMVSLLAQTSSITRTTRGGNTIAMIAAEAGQLEVLKLLVDRYEADLVGTNTLRETALHLAALNGQSCVVEYILSKDPTLTKAREFRRGNTPLIYAAKGGYLETVKKIVHSDPASLHVQNNRDRTALMYAAQKGHADVVEWLVNQGASVHVRDTDGLTAIALAEQADIVEFLSRRQKQRRT